MGALSKEALLQAAAAPRPRERVEIPELGGYVWVQGMSGKERDAWERSLMVGRGARRDVDTTNVRARLAVRCLVNDDGARLFEDHEAGLLGELRVDALNKIFSAAQKVCGVSNEDLDELGQSSGAADGSALPTSSRAISGA